VALVLGTELLDQLNEVVFLLNVRLIRTRTQGESPLMGRPRKPPSELTTKEALQKLFPPEVRKEARKTAKDAGKKSTKKESK
jgi:hypothetical protein